MSNKFNLKLLLLLALASCGMPNQTEVGTSEPVQSTHILDDVSLSNSRDIVIKLKPDTEINHFLQNHPTLTAFQKISGSRNIHLLKIPQGQSLTRTLQDLSSEQSVAFAEPNPSFKIPDYKVMGFRTQALQPNDPKYGLQWNMKSSKVNEAWDLVTGNPNIKVAVIDSGVDPNHEDLRDHLDSLEDIWNEAKGQDVFTNPLTGQTTNYGGKDGNGHGTHVTGVIAAQMNNRIGVSGVAGGGIRIIPIKATSHDGNTDAAVLTMAFQRAIDRGAQVINISIGGPRSKSTQALEDVINLALQKNISIVSATGNESSRKDNLISAITVPAAYPGVIAVGAHTEFDKVANYSNGGPEVDLVAPGGGGRNQNLGEGQQVWSTWPSYKTFEFEQRRVVSLTYAATSGTSMACPHVTGVVALMLSREPQLTPAQIRARLIATAEDIDAAGFDQATGYGKLNALKALQWTSHDAQ